MGKRYQKRLRDLSSLLINTHQSQLLASMYTFTLFRGYCQYLAIIRHHEIISIFSLFQSDQTYTTQAALSVQILMSAQLENYQALSFANKICHFLLKTFLLKYVLGNAHKLFTEVRDNITCNLFTMIIWLQLKQFKQDLYQRCAEPYLITLNIRDEFFCIKMHRRDFYI